MSTEHEQGPPEQLPTEYVVKAVPGLPDFRPGDDLVGELCAAAPWLQDGDIVAITSKAVSKVEGRLIQIPDGVDPADARWEAVNGESVSVVAEVPGVRIVRTTQGFTMAAAGVDASNVRADELALLPVDANESARRIRAQIADRAGVDVAVIITDTAGRAWRGGLIDFAVGSAGIEPLRDLRGSTDTHGRPLSVTALAQIDELASASEIVRGKLGRIAAAVIRGVPFSHSDEGAEALLRPLREDMFSLGTRDVVTAITSPSTGEPADPALIEAAVARTPLPDGVDVSVEGSQCTVRAADDFDAGVAAARLQVALRAEGLHAAISRGTPVTLQVTVAGPYAGLPR